MLSEELGLLHLEKPDKKLQKFKEFLHQKEEEELDFKRQLKKIFGQLLKNNRLNIML
jgi:hypothetical protein